MLDDMAESFLFGRGRLGKTLKSPRAFSLVELLVVVTLLGVMLTLGATALGGGVRGQEISQAGGVLSDLSTLARQHALSKNTRTALVVAEVPGAAGNRWAASIWDGTSALQLERWNLLPESVEVVADTPGKYDGCKYRGAALPEPAAFWFYPDGRMGSDPEARKLKVQGKNTKENYYELVFNPATGSVKVNRP